MDLTRTVIDSGGKAVSFDIIANNSFVAWEGNVMDAKMYVHPFVKSYLEHYLVPFKEYLTHIGNVS